MFATFSRFRRRVAVLTVLAMVASVLVAAAPVAAADDPKADYKATFDACGMAPSSGFEDVPMSHANAGDIDCIAYYGITKGTSATTYSPLMSVTREHMALFLTRLAGLVGIDVVSDPDDAGFTDTGDLSMESQTAINQLADLGITMGTSATTYSPADSVTRGQMALFISRLMDKMTPMMESKTKVYGYTPSKVVAVEDDDSTPNKDETKKIGSPYTDLGNVTKTTYDAITNLYELGVAMGISDTAYGPSALITRASMAGFMAAVLDHSNARPAGISIQASKTMGFGVLAPTIAVSYRSDDFMPMADMSIKTFYTSSDSDDTDAAKLTEDNTCMMADDCSWSDAEDLTDMYGNLYLSGSADDGEKNTYYAWMGAKNGDKFDADTSNHAMVTLSSTKDATTLKVTTDINKNSSPDMNQVDMDVDNSVTITVQLTDGSANVAKSGVKITVGLAKNTLTGADGSDTSADTEFSNPDAATLTTDDMGMATYTVTGPTATKNDDRDRTDTVDFTSEGLTAGQSVIDWIDAAETLTSGKGSVPDYLIISDGKVSIRASVSYYDQYGNPSGVGHRVGITIGAGNTAVVKPVNSRGMASHRGSVDATKDTDITVSYADLVDADGAAVTGAPSVGDETVTPVSHAPDDSTRAAADIDDVFGDDNRFHIAGDLYTYDSDDTFLEGGEKITMAEFETKIGANLKTITTAANIQVVLYDDDGTSIFRVVSDAA